MGCRNLGICRKRRNPGCGGRVRNRGSRKMGGQVGSGTFGPDGRKLRSYGATSELYQVGIVLSVRCLLSGQ